MTDQTTLDLAARDHILARHQRRALCRWLEWECYRATEWMGDGTTTPVSANTAREILRARDIELADARVLGGVFPSSRWKQVGEINSDSGRCHARKIRQFRPRVMIEFVAMPDFLKGGCHARFQ